MPGKISPLRSVKAFIQEENCSAGCSGPDGCKFDVYTADVNIDILSATVKDKRIEGVSVTLQRNGAQSVSGTTNASGSVNLGSTFADDQDALLIVKKRAILIWWSNVRVLA